jgi:nitronate monooxygenase
VNANFLLPRLKAAGVDLDTATGAHAMDMGSEARAWTNVWSAGQGVGSIRDVPPTAELCARLRDEYRIAVRAMADDPFVAG